MLPKKTRQWERKDQEVEVERTNLTEALSGENRQEVVAAEFLKSGIPIGKIDRLRPLLEKIAIYLPLAPISDST